MTTLVCAGLRAHRARNARALFDPATVVELRLSFDNAAKRSLTGAPRRYVPGVLEYEGIKYPMAVHIKGHRSKRKLAEKPAFKLQFDRYSKTGAFLGMRKLNLNNMVDDPTMMRELLSFEFLGSLDLHHPRAAYARLIVNNKPQGLYLVVESMDDDFTNRITGDNHGPLYEAAYGCDLFWDDVEGFDLDAGQDPDQRQLRILTNRAHGNSRQLFDDKDGPLAMRQFIDFLAFSAFVGDFDGYRHSHNYYLYQNPELETWQFISWGLDRTFKKRLTIYDSDGWLARRCFDDGPCRLKYVRRLERMATQFENLQLTERVTKLQILKRTSLEGEKRTSQTKSKATRATTALLDFIRERPSEIRDQLGCIDSHGNELDSDNDGFGCLDCRDNDSKIHPHAKETCNKVDDNCSGLVDDHPACSCASFTFKSQNYSLCAQPMTWASAAEFCEARGEQLARLQTATESRALHKATQKLDKQRWWLGYSDRKKEGRFRWRDGSKGDFTFWKDKQPDNGTCNQDCVALDKKGHGRWIDTHCNQRRPFICSSLAGEPSGT